MKNDKREILGKLNALKDGDRTPTLLSDIAALVFSHPSLFVKVARNHFSVPKSTFKDVLAGGSAHPCGARETWSNYVGTQVAQPVRIECPTSLRELKDVLAAADAAQLPIRAVGSHHAWSDAALTDGVAIETTRLLDSVRPVDRATLRDPAQADPLVWVPGGMTIAALNEALDELDLALINMGGYDGQTLAGAISTSTHGSGLRLGSFPAFVEALVIVKSDGTVVQIEKSHGPTDRAKFKPGTDLDVSLEQHDALFNATVVGMGCFGVILTVMLRVRPQYRLKEVRHIATWRAVRQEIRAGLPDSARHVEVWINPHARGSDHTCLVTLRDITEESPGGHRPFGSLFGEFLASSSAADDVLAWLFNTFPRLAPNLIDNALNALEQETPYIAASPTIFNVGASNDFAAVCSELGVDLDRHVEAADAMLVLARQSQDQEIFQSGPIVLRYVAPSPGFLSMQPGPTCMIELPMLRDVFASSELLWRYEQLLTRDFKARPHWGQLNFLTGSHDMLRRLYGERPVDDWLQVFRTFNPREAFRSRFTDRVGFTSHAPAP